MILLKPVTDRESTKPLARRPPESGGVSDREDEFVDRLPDEERYLTRAPTKTESLAQGGCIPGRAQVRHVRDLNYLPPERLG